MTSPTPEAYEPSEADVIAMADHPLIAVWQAGVSAATSLDFRDADDELNEAMYVRYALNVMRRVHAEVEAQVRAKVAEEIRQHAQDEIRLQSSWLWHRLGESLLEEVADRFAARITEPPPRICANCDLPVAKARTSTGWTHVGDWSGVRCLGGITGARIAEGKGDET